MFRTLLTKTLFTLRWALLGWVLGVMAIVFLTMVVFNSFNQTGIDNIVNSVPKEFRGLIGEVNDFVTVPGYIGQQIFGPNVYIITIIMGIMLALAVSSREEDNGILQTLVTLPVSRTQVYFQKLGALLIVLAITIASAIPALWLALLIIGKTADFARVSESVFELFVITSAYGIIAYAAAMATGRRTAAILISAAYAAASLIISTLAPAVNALKTVDRFSLLHYYNSPQIMTHGVEVKDVAVLAAACLVVIIIGWVRFVRRNIYSS